LGIAVVWRAFQAVVGWFEVTINFRWNLIVAYGLAVSYPNCGHLTNMFFLIADYYFELLSNYAFKVIILMKVLFSLFF